MHLYGLPGLKRLGNKLSRVSISGHLSDLSETKTKPASWGSAELGNAHYIHCSQEANYFSGHAPNIEFWREKNSNIISVSEKYRLFR